MFDRIHEIQKSLAAQNMDAWLLFDNHGSNRFARQLLSIPSELVLTRRFFYLIPAHGEPLKILHQIEGEALDYLPGEKRLYLSWKDLEKVLEESLRNYEKIAMEYSPRSAIPHISVLDAGMMELLTSLGKKIVSSADLLQEFTSVLSEAEIHNHREAAEVIEKTLEKAWDMIATKVRQEKKITEYDVQKFILSEFTAHNCITEEGPTCSVNEHTASPHYIATKFSAEAIEHGDYIMIDLWCKMNVPNGVYADITRVAMLAPEPTPKIQEIFALVKTAQESGIKLIKDRFGAQKPLYGYEIDDVCRSVVEKAGYGQYFTHRTGHNIDSNVHGSGAHLDNLETADKRRILPSTCFSIEPGIYIPGEFGVRLESNIIIDAKGRVEITGKTEDSILCLL